MEMTESEASLLTGLEVDPLYDALVGLYMELGRTYQRRIKAGISADPEEDARKASEAFTNAMMTVTCKENKPEDLKQYLMNAKRDLASEEA